MADETRRTIIEIQLNDQSAQKAEKALATVQKQVDKTADVAIAAQKRQASEVERLQKQMIQMQEKAENEKARIAGAKVETVGRASTALSGVASVVGRNTAIGGALGIGGDVFGAAENVSKFKSQLTELSQGMAAAGGVSGKFAGAVGSLGAVMGPAAVAAVAVTAAVGLYINSIKDQSEALASYTRVQKEYFDLLQNGTTEQAKTQLKVAQDQLKSLEMQRAALQGKLDQSFADDTKQTLGYLGAQIRTGARDIFDGGWKESKTALENIDKQLLDNKTKVELLNGALKNNALATNDAIENEKKLAQQRLAAIDAAMAAEIDYAKTARTGTPQGVRDRITDLQEQAAALANAYAKALEGTDQASKERAEQLRKQYEKVNATIADLTNLLPQVDKHALDTVDAIKLLNDALGETAEIGKRGNQSKLLSRGSEDDYRERRGAARTAYTSISETLAEKEKQVALQRAQQAEQDAIDQQRAGIEASFAKRIAAAKDKQAEQERADAIAKLRTDAAKADSKAAQDYQRADQKAAQDFQKRNEQAAADLYKRREQINAQYMASEVKAVQDFNRAQQQAQAAGMKERLRFMEDWQDRLNGAAADRDVARFIEEQKSGEKQLRRMTEDADEATKRQVDQFTRERETARDERAKQLADLQTSFEDDRAARQAEYDTQRAERQAEYEQARADRAADLEERIAAEIEAGQKRRDQAQELEDELAKLRDQWAEEDKQRRVAAENEATNAELAALRTKHAQALDELNGYLELERQAKENAAKKAAEYAHTAQAAAESAAQSQQATEGRTSQHSHATGLAYVPYDGYQATLHKGERIVPANQNMPQLTVNMTVGDVASGAMVRDELNSLVRSIETVWRSR